MLEHTLIQFLVALFTSLAGLSIFVWAVLSGQFIDIEEPKYRALQSEVAKDDRKDKH